MIGYPKFINTKDDLTYCLENFPGDSRNTTFLQSLLDERFGWWPAGKIEGDGVTDDTHKVVEMETESGVEKWQYELRENLTARIYQLGLTVVEVESWLAEE